MLIGPSSARLSPPLSSVWRSSAALSIAAPGNDSLYGILPSGTITAIDASSGVARWATSGTYAPTRLARQGTRLFAYRMGQGFSYIDDHGSTVSEQLALSFGVASGVHLSTPVIDRRMVYLAVNQGLYAVDQDRGLLFATSLSENTPHTVGLVTDDHIVVVDGMGTPTRYHVGKAGFEQVWEGTPIGGGGSYTEHPFVVTNSMLLIGAGDVLAAYSLADGRIAWRRQNTPVTAIAVSGENAFVGYAGGTVWALRVSDGQLLWNRQYLYDTKAQQEVGLVVAGDSLFYGCTLSSNPDKAFLMTLNIQDGNLTWVSRSVSGSWAGGIPVTDGTRLFVYNSAHSGCYEPLTATPRVSSDAIAVSPRPLRGPSSGFGDGSVSVNLPGAARVSIAAYREQSGLAAPIVTNANWSAGTHQVSWTTTGSTGFTDQNQFGYILVDIEEATGAKYTLPTLIPVNTFPDILWHWSRNSVEVMVYHKFLSGYPDQLFRPDNLVTRAESSTIIAKTLGLTGPTQGFRTAFTDIASHWARDFIMALEERRIVGGFAEPDGTFTFRPEATMTRGQEARILVRAYEIPAAPSWFQTEFTDIQDHWARADIEALEAKGYVNGFREADGTFTYRPEQNLSRAELCTLVVRVRGLRR